MQKFPLCASSNTLRVKIDPLCGKMVLMFVRYKRSDNGLEVVILFYTISRDSNLKHSNKNPV